MRLDVYVHDAHDEIIPLLKLINDKVTHIMSKMDEVQAALEAANAILVSVGDKMDLALPEVAKIGTETQTLVAAVANLTAIISAGGGTTPGVDAALAAMQVSADRLKVSSDALTGKLQEVDQLVPDAPITPTP